MVLTNTDTVIIHDSPLYNLKIKLGKNNTLIFMQLFTQVVNTRFIPKTKSILKKQLPTVLDTVCYNELSLPFDKEVEATEIGHLFEHILLESLCLEKIKNGNRSVEYNGNTEWNWVEKPYGSFKITVDSGFEDLVYFIKAIKKSISITDSVLLSSISVNTNTIPPAFSEFTNPRIWLNFTEYATSR